MPCEELFIQCLTVIYVYPCKNSKSQLIKKRVSLELHTTTKKLKDQTNNRTFSIYYFVFPSKKSKILARIATSKKWMTRQRVCDSADESNRHQHEGEPLLQEIAGIVSDIMRLLVYTKIDYRWWCMETTSCYALTLQRLISVGWC